MLAAPMPGSYAPILTLPLQRARDLRRAKAQSAQTMYGAAGAQRRAAWMAASQPHSAFLLHFHAKEVKPLVAPPTSPTSPTSVSAQQRPVAGLATQLLREQDEDLMALDDDAFLLRCQQLGFSPPATAERSAESDDEEALW